MPVETNVTIVKKSLGRDNIKSDKTNLSMSTRRKSLPVFPNERNTKIYSRPTQFTKEVEENNCLPKMYLSSRLEIL